MYKVRKIKTTFIDNDSIACEVHETKFRVPPQMKFIVDVDKIAKKFTKGKTNRVFYTEVQTNRGKFVYFCAGKLL